MGRLSLIAAVTTLVVGLSPTASATKPAPKVLGAMTKFMAAYDAVADNPAGQFTCVFSGQSIPASYVNDNYCDCPDGSDEPGTSACSSLRATGGMPQDFVFQCDAATTLGIHHRVHFHHSRVDDGICDCCDGSDERRSGATCVDRCAEDAAKAAKEEEERETRRQQGLKVKAEMILQAANKKKEHLQAMEEAKAQLPAVESELTAAEETKKVAEEKETAEREFIKANSLQEKEKWEAEQKAKAEASAAASAASGSSSSGSGSEEAPAIQCRSWRQTKDCKGTGVRESENDRDCLITMASGTSGFCECFDVAKGEEVLHPFDCGHKQLRCADVCKHGPENDLAFAADPSIVPDAPKAPEFKLDDGSSFTLPEARDARDKVAEIMQKKLTLENKIKDNTDDKDYGEDSVFLSLVGSCFDKDAGHYTYTFCPFEEMRQVAKSGGNTGMGRWKSWGEQTYSSWAKNKNDFTRQMYDGGQHCWGGPSRSTEVHIICGPDNLLVSVDEPSMCTYKAVFQTPAACE